MNIVSRIRKSNFISGVISISFGNILGQVITIITLPILSRIYSQEAFGEYGVIVSLTTIFTSFITLGLTSAIMEPKDNKESRRILFSAIITQGLMLFVLFNGTVLLKNSYKFFEVSGSYTLGVALMYAYAFFANMSSLVYTYVNKLGNNKILLVNPIIRALAIIFVAIPLGFLNFNYVGFMVAFIFAEIASSLQMIIRVRPFSGVGVFSANDYLEVIKKYKRYIIYQCPANAIGTFGAQLPTQYLARLFDNAILGSYTMCGKIISMPVSILSKPISNIYFRTASEYQKENKDLSWFTFRIVAYSLLICLVPLLTLVFFGESLFVFVLGENWEEAGKIASIVGLQYVLMFVAQCLSYCRVAIGKQNINLIYSLIDVFITIFVCIIGYSIEGSLITTVAVIAIGKCLVYIIDILLNFICMKKNVLKVAALLISYTAAVGILIYLKYQVTKGVIA